MAEGDEIGEKSSGIEKKRSTKTVKKMIKGEGEEEE